MKGKLPSHTHWLALMLVSLVSFCCSEMPLQSRPQLGDVSGVVMDITTEWPVAGVTVTCADKSCTVNKGGTYLISGIPVGFYELKASKPGYKWYVVGLYVTSNTTHHIYMSEIDLHGTVSGFVCLRGTSQPVSGVVVTCGARSAISDADGLYVLEDVRKGIHRIIAFKHHYITYESEIPVQGDTSYNIYMAASSMTGKVTNALDGPIADARVELESTTAYTDVDGRYRLHVVPQGTHTIACTHPDYHTARTEVTIRNTEKHFDIVVTKTIRDTLTITDDGNVTMADFNGCAGCPAWGSVYDNDGHGGRLKLEYFMRAEAGPPPRTVVGKTRFFIGLPALPSHVTPDIVEKATLALRPTGESHEPGFVSVRRVKPSAADWSENTLTWNNAPDVFSIVHASALVPDDRPWEVDVSSIYQYAGIAEASLRFQKEELGFADPVQYQYFWSSEAPRPEDRPFLVLEYVM